MSTPTIVATAITVVEVAVASTVVGAKAGVAVVVMAGEVEEAGAAVAVMVAEEAGVEDMDVVAVDQWLFMLAP
jgi:hypothetical protein